LNQAAWAIAGVSDISYIWIDFYLLPITPSACLQMEFFFSVLRLRLPRKIYVPKKNASQLADWH
jgi:hypothetical protein